MNNNYQYDPVSNVLKVENLAPPLTHEEATARILSCGGKAKKKKTAKKKNLVGFL